jgi:hypothetical protein
MVIMVHKSRLITEGSPEASQTLFLANTLQTLTMPYKFCPSQHPRSNDHCLILDFVLAMSGNVASSLVGTRKTILLTPGPGAKLTSILYRG